MQVDLRIADNYLEGLIAHPVTPEEAEQGGAYFYGWNPDLPFEPQTHTVELAKNPAKDFVILNLADVQCHDGEAFSQVGEFYEETVDKLIGQTHPDLITLTGDNAFDSFAYLKLIDFLEGYNIPYAPVMGNADHTGCVSEFWIAYRLCHAKNCLFQCGPEGMGYGNYIINITENGAPVHTLFMMDTHHEEEQQAGSYDHLTPEQIEWYTWAVKNTEKQVGKPLPSSVFFHIPVPEYQEAWNSIQSPAGGLLPPYDKQAFCKLHENMGAPLFNNGFFDTCLALGSTKNILCGHDHKNCFSVPYKGITLTYAMKTGYGCYWERETNGGTVLRINSNGETQTEHIYIDPSQSQVKGFMLEYYGVDLYPKHHGD